MNNANSSYVKVIKIKDANGEEKEMCFPLKLDLERPKRPRTMFNEIQLTQLEETFQRKGYVTGNERSRLAEELGLSDTQVKVWFQNRRTKSKKKTVEESAEKSSTSTSMDYVSLSAVSPMETLSDPFPSCIPSQSDTLSHPSSFPHLSHFPMFPPISLPLFPFHLSQNPNNFPSLFTNSSSYFSC